MRPEKTLQEEILHDVCVVLTAAVRQIAGCKHYDGIQTLSIITWERRETCNQYDGCCIGTSVTLAALKSS